MTDGPPTNTHDPTDVPAEEDGTPVCHNCLAPNDPLDHFCQNCGTPLTTIASVDPLGQIQSMGDTYRKALRQSSYSSLAWCGMLLIFAPAAVGILVAFCDVDFGYSPIVWLSAPLVLLLGYLYCRVVWRLCTNTESPPPVVEPEPMQVWNCPQCGAPVEAHFELCWRCSAERGDAPLQELPPDDDVD